MSKSRGTKATQVFYDEAGWKKSESGEALDRELFGVKEDGPIRVRLHEARQARILWALRDMGSGISILECGCGGSPGAFLDGAVDRYTGVDFSKTGIDLAREKFEVVSTPHSFSVADVCNLPFEDGQFDAIYSAHMLYHIEPIGAVSSTAGYAARAEARWRADPAPGQSMARSVPAARPDQAGCLVQASQDVGAKGQGQFAIALQPAIDQLDKIGPVEVRITQGHDRRHSIDTVQPDCQ